MENETCQWYDPSCIFAWLQDELQHFTIWVWDLILSGVAATFESIPVPDFMLNVSAFTIPPSISFFASAFEIPIGVGIVVSAYTARFLLRRIPIVG